jgi:hypothetical protein
MQRIASVDVGRDQQITNPNRVAIPVTDRVPTNIEASNSSWAAWGPHLMNVPVHSIEVWSTGGTAGLAKIEVFVRRADGGGGDKSERGGNASLTSLHKMLRPDYAVDLRLLRRQFGLIFPLASCAASLATAESSGAA